MANHHTQRLQSLSDHRLLFRFSSKCCLMPSHWGAVKGAHPSLLHTLLRLFCIKAILWTLANESPGLRRAQWVNAQTSLFIDSHTISRVPSGTTTGNTWQRGCRGKPTFIIQTVTSVALGWLSQAHETLFSTYMSQNTALITAAESLWVICFMAVMQILLGHRMWAFVLHPYADTVNTLWPTVLFEWLLANKISNCSSFYSFIHSFIYSCIHSFIKQSLQAGWACCVFTQGNQREKEVCKWNWSDKPPTRVHLNTTTFFSF